MKSQTTLFIAGVLAISGLSYSGTSYAGTVVIGENLGASCYREAKSGRSGKTSLDICDSALRDEMLTATDMAATYVNRGIVRSASGDISGAIKDYDRALSINPQLAEAFANRGTALMRQTRYEQALTELNQALSLKPKDPGSVYFNRGILYEHFGDLKQAYLDYTRASELRPEWRQPKQELERFAVHKKTVD